MQYFEKLQVKALISSVFSHTVLPLGEAREDRCSTVVPSELTHTFQDGRRKFVRLRRQINAICLGVHKCASLRGPFPALRRVNNCQGGASEVYRCSEESVRPAQLPANHVESSRAEAFVHCTHTGGLGCSVMLLL